MSRPSRFPLVLQACLHSLPAPYSVAERLGIFPFCRHAISDPTRPGRDVGLVIGPRENWYTADRANQLLADEAWRVLQDEHSIERIGVMLLANVPECQGSFRMFGVDLDNLWAIGRHSELPWLWCFERLFRTLDTPAPSNPPTPPPAPTAPTSATPDPFALLRQFARDRLKGSQRRVLEALCDANGELPLETVGGICGWMRPIESAWGSLRSNLNQKLRPLGWQIRTFDRTARLVSI